MKDKKGQLFIEDDQQPSRKFSADKRTPQSIENKEFNADHWNVGGPPFKIVEKPRRTDT